MPTDKSISAQEAGVFLPGHFIRSQRGLGYVVMPSRQHMQIPHGENDVLVRWRDDSISWIDQKELKFRD